MTKFQRYIKCNSQRILNLLFYQDMYAIKTSRTPFLLYRGRKQGVLGISTNIVTTGKLDYLQQIM